MTDGGRPTDSALRWIPDLDAMLGHIATAAETLQVARSPKETWDRAARIAFYKAIRQRLDALSYALGQGRGKLNPYIYVEGVHKRIPAHFRGDFFRAGCYPDAAIIVPDRYAIAIELDHGKSGARLRNALAKASFNVLMGAFDYAVVVFDPEGRDMQITPVEQRVLDFFEKQLRTRLVFTGRRALGA